MGDNQSKSYLKQFLDHRPEPDMASTNEVRGSYRERFMAATSGQGDAFLSGQDKQEITTDSEKETQLVQKNTRFLWSEQVARFHEDALPCLSKKSVQKLEANFRELMIIEANINSLVGNGNTLYVSSCSDKDGKTIAATSVAYALSFYSGKNVLLVDGNHHNPQVHSLFGVSEAPGFHELVNSGMALEQVILPTRHKGLSILTIGDLQAFPHGGGAFGDMVRQLSECFDYVVWDGVSIMTSSVALRDIIHFSGALLVVECEKTRWELVQIAGDKIRKSGGPSSIGIVYNRRKYYIPKGIYNLIS